VDDLLLVQRADEVGLHLRPEYIQEVIEGIKKENNIKDDASSSASSAARHVDRRPERNIHRSILRRQVLSRDLEGKFTVTEAEARAEYEAKKAEYTRSASVVLPGDRALARAGRARGADRGPRPGPARLRRPRQAVFEGVLGAAAATSAG
jgi:hypothetical protein